MERRGGYHQFCPVSLAAEIVCARWTPLILRDLFAGSTRFNDLQRGVPRMSPTLLSKRLKEMEAAGLIRRVPGREAGGSEYHLTEAGRDLGPVVDALGFWGLRWVDPELSLGKLDAPLLMWNMRGQFDPLPRPERRCTIEFNYPDAPQKKRRYWLLVEPDDVDLCITDPGFETDVYVTSPLRTMTSIWMAFSTPRREIEEGRLELDGPTDLVGMVRGWLGQSPAAKARSSLAA